MIHFPCSSCHYEVSAPEDKVGTFMLCPSCFTQLRIPPPVTNERIEDAMAMAQIYGLQAGGEGKKLKEMIPVHCPVCNTLMYSSVERIGSFFKCPDCGTKTLARPDLDRK